MAVTIALRHFGICGTALFYNDHRYNECGEKCGEMQVIPIA